MEASYDSMKDRFDFLKKKYNITYKSIGDVLGMTYDAVRMAVKRESFSRLQLSKIEQMFGISEKWIKSGQGNIIDESPFTYEKEGKIFRVVPGENDKPLSPSDQTLVTEPSHRYGRDIVVAILEKAKETGRITPAQVDAVIKRIEEGYAIARAYSEHLDRLEKINKR